MAYIDGYVLPAPLKKLDEYKKLARKAGKLWIEHGALGYHECVADDMSVPMGVPFPDLVKSKRGETIIFAWILYKSRAHRDRVNKSVMADERLSAMCPDPKSMPFDCNRMAYGGFKTMVDYVAEE